VPLYESLECGGSSVEEGVEQNPVVPSGLNLGSLLCGGSFGGNGEDSCHYWWGYLWNFI
jgi:hypothetical protein